MSEIKTYDQILREQHTKQTSPLGMELFTSMLNDDPMSFMDGGTIYETKLGEDVKMVFAGLTSLVAEQADKVDETQLTQPQKLALSFVKTVTKVQEKPDEEVTDSGD